MARFDIHSYHCVDILVFELRHLDCHPLLGHPFHYLVDEAVHVRKAEVEGVVSSWKVVFGVGLLELPDIKLGVLDSRLFTLMVRMAPRFP